MTVFNEENAAYLVDEFIKNIPSYPKKRYAGKGIVTCAGGIVYNTCAWVLIRQLRKLGCELPIQVWYLGEGEYDEAWVKLVEPYDVECVDAYEVRAKFPHPNLYGYEIKPFSLVHSPFEEIIFIDADNVPTVNPTYLFNTRAYRKTGAIFWPDYWQFEPEDKIWQLAGNIPYRNEPQFESGQMVIHKHKCWEPLMLTNWYNMYSPFYYAYLAGDKDTYHMAWRKLERTYSMPDTPIKTLGKLYINHAMGQHDFEGRVIFQHKNHKKWSLSGNDSIPGFQYEKECFEYIKELKGKWKVENKRIDVRYSGTVLDGNGYAAAARNYISALHRNANVTIQSFVYHGETDISEFSDTIYPLINKNIKYTTKITHAIPDSFPDRREPGVKNIGLTIWETTKLPQALVNECNEMDEIWVPTRWNAKIFRESGVQVPISVIPHTFRLKENNANFTENDLQALCQKDFTKGQYKFYSIFDWCERKNPHGLLKAYFSEFSQEDNVCLVIKAHIFHEEDQYKAMQSQIDEIASKFSKKLPPVYLIVGNLSEEQMMGIHKVCDCYVMPHRSEGWGIPLFEAMSWGIPTIATNFGGNTEFMTEYNSFPIKYKLIPVRGMPQFKWYDESQSWADADIDHLKETMRWVFEHPEEAMEKAEQATQDLQMFSWEKIGKLMKHQLDD
jgi:glycosyltransferase involved in cell wall biosynthesis